MSPILMCRPDYYAIEYEINAWMHLDVQVDAALAREQWQAVYDTYRALGQTVELINPVAGLPDLVFSANAGLIWNGRVIPSNFHSPERQGEELPDLAFFEQYGLEVIPLDKSISFEGAGDGLFVGNRLFMGHGFRTDERAVSAVGELLGVEVVSLDLIDPRFYHLDTCFCPIDDHTAIFAPVAFDSESAQRIRETVPRAIEVPEEIAAGFACNALRIGDTLVSSTSALELHDVLSNVGLDIIGLPMSEYIKGGGAVRCLSLPLDVGGGVES